MPPPTSRRQSSLEANLVSFGNKSKEQVTTLFRRAKDSLTAQTKKSKSPNNYSSLAVENDVHAIGVSSLAAGHKTLVPALVDELKKLGAQDVVVIAGGVIPQNDVGFLKTRGVACVFGPGTPIPSAAAEVLRAIPRRAP